MLSAFSQVSAFITPELAALFGTITVNLLPVLGLIFAGGLFFRVLLFLSVKGQAKFTVAFEKQVRELANRAPTMVNPFHVSAKETLEATLQSASLRKSVVAKMLLLREGAARLTKDTVAQLEAMNLDHPAFYEVSRTAFAKNGLFNRVMGVAPVGPMNTLLNAFPGVFVLLGIVGGTLGILASLPAFVGSATDMVAAQKGMDIFMRGFAAALNTAAIAAGLSFGMMVLNFLMSPERIYVRMVDRFANTLEELLKVSGARGPTEISVRRSGPAPQAEEEVEENEVTGDFTPPSLSVPPPRLSAEDIVADIKAHEHDGEEGEALGTPPPSAPEAEAESELHAQVENAATEEELPAYEAAVPEMEERDEDSQITKIEEVALDAEELRKLQMYDHPEEAAKVETDSISISSMAPAPPAPRTNLPPLSAEEEMPEPPPAQDELSEIDKALWNTSIKIDETEEENAVEWTAQPTEAEANEEAEETPDDNFPKRPPKAA